jgi:hypothetical protein
MKISLSPITGNWNSTKALQKKKGRNLMPFSDFYVYMIWVANATYLQSRIGPTVTLRLNICSQGVTGCFTSASVANRLPAMCFLEVQRDGYHWKQDLNWSINCQPQRCNKSQGRWQDGTRRYPALAQQLRPFARNGLPWPSSIRVSQHTRAVQRISDYIFSRGK